VAGAGAAVRGMRSPGFSRKGLAPRAGEDRSQASRGTEVDPGTYVVRADGELLVCAPAQTLPLAQRYFLF